MGELRECLQCLRPLTGRSDKKYCGEYCRNSYNNKANSDTTNYVRNISNILRRNRRILEGVLSLEKTTVQKQVLVDKGFNFNYNTGYTTTKDSNVYVYCYEYGYLQLSNEQVLVVKKR